MGFFNIFKNKNIQKSDNFFESLNKEVFPNGEKQLKKETFELHKKLKNHYSFKILVDNYKYARYMYHLTREKTVENILNLLNQNKNNVLTKQDVEILIKYIEKKDTPIYLRERILDEPFVINLAASCAQASAQTFTLSYFNQSFNNSVEFEVLLFYMADLSIQLKTIFPNEYDKLINENNEITKGAFNRLNLTNENQEYKNAIDENISFKMEFYRNAIINLEERNYIFNKLYQAAILHPLKTDFLQLIEPIQPSSIEVDKFKTILCEKLYLQRQKIENYDSPYNIFTKINY